MHRIAITDCPKNYDHYKDWLCLLDGSIECIKLSHHDNDPQDIIRCGGLLLTGGEDVALSLYYRKLIEKKGIISFPEDISALIPQEEKKKAHNVDKKRDDFELKVIEEALKMRIPILGICRGLQIENVFFGGTLVRDLGEKNETHRKENGRDRTHGITIENGSLLKKITGLSKGDVNSTHHQAVEDPGDSLIVSARSDDGVIEALERKEKHESGFLLLIQWHPERMEDKESPLRKNIGLSFINSFT